MNSFRRCASALLCALALAGCQNISASHGDANSTASTSELNLNNTSWMLPLPKGSTCEVPPMIEFSDGRASGDLGCNRFDGTVKIDGEKLQFEQVAVTMKMCAPQYMALETQMLKVLNDARSARRTNTSLTFFDKAGNEILTMVPEVAGACD